MLDPTSAVFQKGGLNLKYPRLVTAGTFFGVLLSSSCSLPGLITQQVTVRTTTEVLCPPLKVVQTCLASRLLLQSCAFVFSINSRGEHNNHAAKSLLHVNDELLALVDLTA